MMFINFSKWSVIGLYVVMLLLCTLFQTLQTLFTALQIIRTVASLYTASHSATTTGSDAPLGRIKYCDVRKKEFCHDFSDLLINNSVSQINTYSKSNAFVIPLSELRLCYIQRRGMEYCDIMCSA